MALIYNVLGSVDSKDLDDSRDLDFVLKIWMVLIFKSVLGLVTQMFFTNDLVGSFFFCGLDIDLFPVSLFFCAGRVDSNFLFLSLRVDCGLCFGSIKSGKNDFQKEKKISCEKEFVL